MKTAGQWFESLEAPKYGILSGGFKQIEKSDILEIQLDALKEAQVITRRYCEEDRQYAATVSIDDLISRLEANAPLP